MAITYNQMYGQRDENAKPSKVYVEGRTLPIMQLTAWKDFGKCTLCLSSFAVAVPWTV